MSRRGKGLRFGRSDGYRVRVYMDGLQIGSIARTTDPWHGWWDISEYPKDDLQDTTLRALRKKDVHGLENAKTMIREWVATCAEGALSR